jgi:hypothetical protein
MCRYTLCAFSLACLVVCLGCGSQGQEIPDTAIQISVVNDQPSTSAHVFISFCGVGAVQYGGYSPVGFQIQIGIDGKGSRWIDTYDYCVVNITQFWCGSGLIISPPDPFLNPPSNAKRTFNCQYTQPIPAAVGWPNFSDSMDMIHLDKNPRIVCPIESSSLDPYDEANREIVARGFLGEAETISRQAHALYEWLLVTNPPDSTVENALLSGQSSESQIAYIAAGGQFYSASGGTNSGFVTKVYNKLLGRNPDSWEVDVAVVDLDGYWLWVEEECEPDCIWIDGYYYCDEKQPPCGHDEWYHKTRSEFVWEILSSDEFHQVAARYMYGIQLRRTATPSEIEDQAFHIGAFGLKEGAVRLLKTSQFFNKSRDPW